MSALRARETKDVIDGLCVTSPPDAIVFATGDPTPTGGVIGLKGNLAPDGAIVKVAGMERLHFSGPARCFDGEEA